VTIFPGLTTTVASGTSVTIPTTTNTQNYSFNVTMNGTATVTSTSGSFPSFATLSSEYPNGIPVGGEIGGDPIGTGSATGAPLMVSGTSGTSLTLSVAAPKINTNTQASPTYATATGSGVITIGNGFAAYTTLTEDENLSANTCASSANAPGDFAPETASLAGESQTQIPNSAIVLENVPVALTLNVTYPTIGSGWGDDGGNTAPGQPSTSIDLDGKNAFVPLAIATNGACPAGTAFCYSYTKGTAGPDWLTTSKATMGLTANGTVYCTAAEAQAINSGTGIDSVTARGGTTTTPTDGLGIPQGPASEALTYCDGAAHSPYGIHTPGAALSLIEALEENPNAFVYGSDNTSPESLWSIQAGPASAMVW
jgi:hypothetical protein